MTDPFVAETDKFFDERRCLVEGTGGSTATVDAFEAVDCRCAERFPKDREEACRNQLPVAETADLRAAAITFCSGWKNWILDWVSVFAKVKIALNAISTNNTLNSFQCFDR
ncbi:hypothetical protein [Nostoc sp. 106C]|uniref:hypothetical protein n=1 Tax=Nostoc sp. 106C TaxID=1932667 RepID=UPI00325FF602